MFKFFLLGTLILICWFYFNSWYSVNVKKARLSPSKLTVFYGQPGVGKTTFAAALASQYLRSGIPVYSNVPIDGCYRVDKSDIGRYLIEDCLLIWDEVGVDFHARNFKNNFTPDQIKFWKYHRHERCEVMIFSQGFDDMDKVLRTLATEMYVLRRSFLPYIFNAKLIRKRPNIDEYTHQPIDYYDFVRFKTRRILAPLYWKLFNSYERLGLPPKDFPQWGTSGRKPEAAEHLPVGQTFDEWLELQNLPTTENISG